MLKRPSIASWLLFMAGLLAGSTASAITIADIPGLVRTQNRDVLEAQKDVDAAGQGVRAAYGRYMPTLELKSSYTRLNDDLEIDIEEKRIERDILGGALSVAIAVDPPPITVQEKDVFNSHLLLTQPLYTGGRIGAGVDAALAQKAEAAAHLDRIRNQKTAEALSRYFQVAVAEDVVSILRTMENNLSRLKDMAESLVKSGMTPRFSLLQIQVAQAELEARKLEAGSKRDLAILALQTSLGMDASRQLVAETPLKAMPLVTGLDRFKLQALAKRPEFPLLRAKETQVAALKDAETGKMLPTVYAFGKRELIPGELTALQPLWAVGVGIDIPLTSGITQLPERRKAAILAEKIAIVKTKASQEIPLQVESHYTSAKALDASLKALSEARNMAAEATRLAEIRFKAGEGSSLEVLKAANDLERLEILLRLKTEEYNRALIELYQAAGGLSDYVENYQVFAQKSDGRTGK